MSTTLYSDLSDEVQLHTESVPRATIDLFVRRACIQLCRQSRIWKLQGQETLVPGEDDVCIDSWINDAGSTEKSMITIEELRYEGVPLRRYTEKQIKDLTDEFSKPCGFYQPNLSYITVTNVPDAFYENDDYIEYTVSVAPSSSSTGMDSDIMERYRDGIIYGTVGMLFAVPRKTWTNQASAAYYMAEFARYIAEATTDANQEFARRIPRVVKYGGI